MNTKLVFSFVNQLLARIPNFEDKKKTNMIKTCFRVTLVAIDLAVLELCDDKHVVKLPLMNYSKKN